MTPDLWKNVIAAAVVPVVLISACGLLCLTFYNRLAVIVTRLRVFQHDALEEEEALIPSHPSGDTQRRRRAFSRDTLGALRQQMDRLLRRARLVRCVLFCLLTAILCLVVCSVAAGAGALRPRAMIAAGPAFLAGLAAVFAAVLFALWELTLALDPVERETEFVTQLERKLDPEKGPPETAESTRS